MDRGEIDDIEPQGRDPGQGSLRIAEGAVLRGIAGGRPGKELVPGGEARLTAVRADRKLALAAGEAIGLAVREHERLKLGREAGPNPRVAVGGRIAQERGEIGQPVVILAARVRLGLPDKVRPLQQLGADVLPRLDLLLEGGAPGGEAVDPAFDRDAPLAHPIERERAVPAVVFEGVGHRHRRRPTLSRRQIENPRREHVVSIGEDVGPEPQLVAHQALDRISPAQHGRRDATHDQVGERTIRIAFDRTCRFHENQRKAVRCAPLPPDAARRVTAITA
jgi:hypothetical protein